MTERPVFRPASLDDFVPEVPRQAPQKPRDAGSVGAIGVVSASGQSVRALLEGRLGDGRVLDVAREAAVRVAWRSADLLDDDSPMGMGPVEVRFGPAEAGLAITARVRANDELRARRSALLAVAIAGAGVLAELCATDRSARLTDVRCTDAPLTDARLPDATSPAPGIDA